MSFLLLFLVLCFLSFFSFLLRFLSFLSFLLRLRFFWLEELEDEELDDELSGLTFPSSNCETSGCTCAGDRCPGSAADADLGGAADKSAFLVASRTDLDSVAISKNWISLDVGGLCASLDGGRIEAFCTPD